MKAAIIGAGVIGCSIGLELRRRGFEVEIFDRNGEVGHGSTSASCGIVRRFYSQPGMVALAHEGAHTWADWESFLGPIDDELARFERPGMLFIPPRMDQAVHDIYRSMKELGIKVELLDAAGIRERFPFIDTASHSPPRSPDDA